MNDKQRLGCLCPYAHDYQGSNQSLRYISGGACVVCKKLRAKRDIQLWRETHQNHLRVYSKWYEVNRRPTDQRKLYDMKRSKERKEQYRSYHCLHKSERNAISRAYALSHKGERQNYRKANSERYKAAQTRRRAREKALPATLTAEQWLAILAAYQYRCAYCNDKPKRLSQDHVIPISKGGGTIPSNIVPACISCNSRKSTNEPIRIPAIRLLI